MSFQRDERARLCQLALDTWGVTGHVIPYELSNETLQESIRASALAYFQRHEIKWWTGPADKRTKGMELRPTGHLSSSQLACVNHLEPARVDPMVAQHVLANIEPNLTAAPVADGCVDYEWIGEADYLNEAKSRKKRTRGANVTSLDALMCGQSKDKRILIAFEWKYLERYGGESTVASRSNTDRVATYQRLLEQDDGPICVDDIRSLFHHPYDQLMRQTLLVWQMVEHGEFGASDWLHIHVVPELNVVLRESRAAPDLPGRTMLEKWQSVLREPARYRLVTASDLLRGIRESDWQEWRRWLGQRYQT